MMVRLSIVQELVIGALISTVVIFLVAIMFVYSGQLVLNDKTLNPKTETARDTGSYTLSDVSKHGTPDDCWMIIRGEVYDMNTYIELHPGGERAILSFCGQDATEAYATKGGEGVHSQKAYEDLAKLRIGAVQQ